MHFSEISVNPEDERELSVELGETWRRMTIAGVRSMSSWFGRPEQRK